MSKSDLALGKLNLYRETGSEKFNMLTFGVFKESLRIYVREKDNNPDNKRSRIIMNMPIGFLYARAFLNELETITEKPEDYTFSLDLYGPKWSGEKRVPNDRELMGKIGLARKKNKEGFVVNILTVATNQGVKNVFPIIPTPYLDIVINGKKIEDKTVLSTIWTKAFYRSFSDVLSSLPEVNNERDDNSEANNKNYKKSYDKSKYKKEPVNDDIDDVINDI
jgi:hypothetical protein